MTAGYWSVPWPEESSPDVIAQQVVAMRVCGLSRLCGGRAAGRDLKHIVAQDPRLSTSLLDTHMEQGIHWSCVRSVPFDCP